jgi:L-aminopeptidase/D-esterase-like protein
MSDPGGLGVEGVRVVRPTGEHGYIAAQAVSRDEPPNGRVGASTGAYVSHCRGPAGRRPAGLASYIIRQDDLVVAALCAVNAFGDIDPGDRPTHSDAIQSLSEPFDFNQARMHTTIGVVCTNAALDKPGCRIVAQGAHDGLARAITPPHARFDGDAFIAAATGTVNAAVDAIRYLALTAVCEAIRSAKIHPD